MAIYFFDSSDLVKRYVVEKGSSWVQGITDPAVGHLILIARITHIEVVAAITKRVRNLDISAADGAVAIANFKTDFATQYNPIEITD